MKRLLVVGSAFVALLISPVLSASTADARKKDNASMGFCKSGKKVSDMQKCKENGGKK